MSVHEKDDNLHVSDLGGGFNIFYFQPYLGKIPILTNIFQMAWNHQLEIHWNENDLKLSSTVTFRHHNDGLSEILHPFPPPMCWWGFHLSSPTFCGNSWSIQPWGFPRTFCQMIVFEQPLSFAVGVLAISTPPKFNMEPKKWWFEDDFPFGMAYFQGPCWTSSEGMFFFCACALKTQQI